MLLARIVRRIFRRNAMTETQVDDLLRERAAEYKEETGETLDPFPSIVDLCKTLGIESSFEARKEMWGQFGFDEDSYEGTAEQNRQMVVELRERVALGNFGR